jgi:chemotaxis protein MotB
MHNLDNMSTTTPKQTRAPQPRAHERSPRRRRTAEEPENHDRWLVSYADFITLLFAFFVVMFATSQSDGAKAQQVSDSVKKALAGQPLSVVLAAILGPGPTPKLHAAPHEPATPGSDNRMSELLTSLNALSAELKDEIKARRIDVSMGPRGLIISFRQAALFPSGEDVIAPEAYASLEKIAKAMLQVPNPARLEGHTDSLPIHNSRFRSNWELSAARSIALLDLFTKNFGIPHDRLSIAGYADTAPIADNTTDDGRSRNRRVDIVILNDNGVKGEPDRILHAR